MTATATVLPDGSVTLTDGGTTYPPLSPEAVQAVAAQAKASANASKTRQMTELLGQLSLLITSAGAVSGANAYAQVTVTSGAATAVLDDKSFEMVRESLPGQLDADGYWVVGPLVVQKQAPPTPTPDPTGGTP